MLPMTASSTAGAWVPRSSPCWATSFCAKASASSRDRNAAMWTLYFPTALAARMGAATGAIVAVWVCCLTAFLAISGLGLALPPVTTVELLQLDVSGSAWAVDAVVTAADSGAAGAGGGDPPPKRFEKKPDTEDVELDAGAGAAGATGEASAGPAIANVFEPADSAGAADSAGERTTVAAAAACNPPASTGP